MTYKDNNDKAIQFGEAHLRQIGGRAKILQAEYDAMVGTPFKLGGVFARHKGMDKEQRRQALLDEREEEIHRYTEEYRKISLVIEDLKDCLIKREEWDESFFLAMAGANRSEIARYTGSKSFLRDE